MMLETKRIGYFIIPVIMEECVEVFVAGEGSVVGPVWKRGQIMERDALALLTKGGTHLHRLQSGDWVKVLAGRCVT